MRKTHLYTLLCVLCFPSLVCAQQAVFDEFRKAAGDYAALYSGKAEENYNQQKYLNHPYWNTDEFREGAVCYGRWLYSDLQLRYDTYKKSLIVVTPEKRITLQVDMRKVDYFVIEGQKFVPQGDCFAALLYDSPQMCLTQYIVSTMESQVKKKRSLLQPVQEKELFQSSQWQNRLCDNFPFGFLETFSYIQEAVEGLLPERAAGLQGKWRCPGNDPVNGIY